MLAYNTIYLSTLPVLPLLQILHYLQYGPQYCIKAMLHAWMHLPYFTAGVVDNSS